MRNAAVADEAGVRGDSAEESSAFDLVLGGKRLHV